ncbi:MAG TPA: DNA methyltransferase [Xanthobacteraceae bacterium]|nr:DNA methyltransferase [Xanthobacteraceae bacterium]
MSGFAFHEIQQMDLAALTPNPRNARTHAKKQVAQIAASIRAFGWTVPLVVDEQAMILAGHGRYLAARQLALAQVPVVVVTGLSAAKKRALALADNKIAANAGWDRDQLAAELGELAPLLAACELELEITGFAPAEIDNLMADLIDPEAEPADAVPALADHAVSQSGDLWQLGRHRLGCGDARDAAAWQAVMAQERAAMMFTDPPYNVRIAAVVGRGKAQYREFAAASGELSSAEFVAFLTAPLKLAARHSAAGALHYVCIDWRHLRELQAAGDAVAAELLNIIVWAKTNAGQGSLYRSQHELIFLFRHGAAPHRNNVELGRHGRNRSNVWSYAGVNTFRAGRMADLSAHPTPKPVAMIADAMRDCTRRGDIVLDPFLGSGSTLLAAERVGRRGFGLEIDPLYVDLAIRRWQAFTGKDAVLAATGATFDEVAAARPAPAARRTP